MKLFSIYICTKTEYYSFVYNNTLYENDYIIIFQIITIFYYCCYKY